MSKKSRYRCFRVPELILFLIVGGVSAQNSTVDSAAAVAIELEMEASVDTAITLETTVAAEMDSVGISVETADLTDSAESASDPDSQAVELPPLEKMPVLTQFVEAQYPPEAYGKGLEGTVVMELLVNDSGIVESVTVAQGLDPQLDSSAVIAARQFRFDPARADGGPVAVLIQYEYRFSLQEVVKTIDEYVNFSGRVVERGTRAPLAEAMVVVSFPDTTCAGGLDVPLAAYLERIGSFEGQYLEESSLVTFTDSSGYFAFKSLPPCSILVKIPAPGYQAFEETEEISKGEATAVTYRIDRVSYNDYEVVVYGKAEKKEVAKRSLNSTEVKKIPGFGGDAVKVVQALPGVSRPTFGSGQIIIRGARTWDSQFLLDGVEIPQLYHFGGLKSTYNSNALKSVDLYPGGFSARYGNAVGGVVEIKGRPGKDDRVHGMGDASLVDASFLVEGPVKDHATVLVSARRSYVGDLLGWAVKNVPALDIPITVAPFYWDYILRTDLKLHPKHKTFLTFFGSKDALDIIVPGIRGGSKLVDDVVDRVKQENLFHMILAGWDWEITKRLTNELRCDFIGARNETSLFGIAKWTARAKTLQIHDELSYKLLPSLTMVAGAAGQYTPYQQESVFPSATGEFLFDTLKSTYGNAAAYVNAEWSPIKQLLVVPGLRYDYYPELRHRGGIVPELWDYEQFNNDRGFSGDPSLRLMARYTPFENHTVKFSFGNYNQTPEPRGLATHADFGNPDLPTTKAQHFVGGYEWQATDLLYIDAQLYLNRQWDIPDFETGADLTDDSFDPSSTQRFYPEGRARMRGLELLVRHDQGHHFFGWVAYTLSLAERYDRIKKEYVLFGQDQTHNLQVVGSWRLPRNWEAGLRARYVSGNPATPVVWSYFDSYNRMYVSEPGKINSVRLDPFFQLDIRVDKKFVFDAFLMSLYLDLQNVSYFVYKSPELRVPNYNPYNVKLGEEDSQPISYPFLPSIGISVEF